MEHLPSFSNPVPDFEAFEYDIDVEGSKPPELIQPRDIEPHDNNSAIKNEPTRRTIEEELQALDRAEAKDRMEQKRAQKFASEQTAARLAEEEARRRDAEARAKAIEKAFLAEIKAEQARTKIIEKKAVAASSDQAVLDTFAGAFAEQFEKALTSEFKPDRAVQSSSKTPAIRGKSEKKIDSLPSSLARATSFLRKPSIVASIGASIAAAIIAVSGCGPSQDDLRRKDQKIEKLEDHQAILERDKKRLEEDKAALQKELEEKEKKRLQELEEINKKLEKLETEVKKCSDSRAREKASHRLPRARQTSEIPSSKLPERPTAAPSEKPKVIERKVPESVKKKGGEVPPYEHRSSSCLPPEPERENFWRKLVRPLHSFLLKKDQPSATALAAIEKNFENAHVLRSELVQGSTTYFTKKGTRIVPHSPQLQAARQILAERLGDFIARWGRTFQANPPTARDVTTMSNELLAFYNRGAELDQGELGYERTMISRETKWYSGQDVPSPHYHPLGAPIATPGQMPSERGASMILENHDLTTFLNEGKGATQATQDHIEMRKDFGLTREQTEKISLQKSPATSWWQRWRNSNFFKKEPKPSKNTLKSIATVEGVLKAK